jgi:hypothetical protein
MYQRFDSFGKLILVSVCILAGMATSLAQSVTLRPVDTGKDVVTFNPGNANRQPRTQRAPRESRFAASGDRFAVKTNVVYLFGTLTPNVAFEYGLGRRTSVEAGVGYNQWHSLWDFASRGPEYDPDNLYKRRFDHLFVRAGFHYWLRDRFEGHFVGGGLFYAHYNTGEIKLPGAFDSASDYYGNAFGANALYGWRWRFHHRWAAEFSIGLGAAMLVHDKSTIGIDMISGEPILYNPIRETKVYIGPTSLGVKLVFTIK